MIRVEVQWMPLKSATTISKPFRINDLLATVRRTGGRFEEGVTKLKRLRASSLANPIRRNILRLLQSRKHATHGTHKRTI